MRRTEFVLLTVVAFSLGMFTSANPSVHAADKDKDNKTTENQSNDKSDNGQQYAFLGVVIEPLQSGMAAHLPSVSHGQGVMIRHVMPDSAADKAGLKQNDIIVQFGDQKIFSAEQFHKLVSSEKPGKQMEMTYVRDGKTSTAHVTLGHSSQDSTRQAWNHGGGRFVFPHIGQRLMHRNHDQTSANENGNWESFDSMTLKRQKDGKFQAEISYMNKDGKLEHQTFQGSREEIEKSIRAEKDMPVGERHRLLHAVGGPIRGAFAPSGFDDNDFWLELPGRAAQF